jgi:cellulose synthase/poly-beta-1,6-N-acetylglucosamine synthase-like glycosyltransferase
MKFKPLKNSKLIYLAFCIPFILAYVSWQFFPIFAHWLITSIFNYEVSQPPNWLWYAIVHFFYSWYTFLAIGVAGVWAIAATLARKQRKESGKKYYPMVSFIVPAYNEEKNVSRCITSLFKCTEKYHGLCEIIVVDDARAIALKYAYNSHNYRTLLFYTPFYPILRLINVLARLTSSVKYVLGDHGNWHNKVRIKL